MTAIQRQPAPLTKAEGKQAHAPFQLEDDRRRWQRWRYWARCSRRQHGSWHCPPFRGSDEFSHAFRQPPLHFFVGVVLMAGLALGRANPRHRLVPGLVTVSIALTALAHTVSAANVLRSELHQSASAHDPAWIHPAMWMIALLVVMAWAFYALSIEEHLKSRSLA